MSFAPRVNVLGNPLQLVNVGSGPTTGFFRNNYCDATPLDRASHTVAAQVTPEFLAFSASKGNDLRPLLGPDCTWCLCAARWKEAVDAAATHQDGEKIIPKVDLAATHQAVLDTPGVTFDLLKKYGKPETCTPTNGDLSGRQV